MAQPAEPCDHCSKLIPPRESTSNLTHYPTMGGLRQSSLHCPICRVIGKHSLRLKKYIRFPNLNEAEYEFMVLEMKYVEVRISSSGLAWGLLRVVMSIPPGVGHHTFTFSITACNSETTAAALPIWTSDITSMGDKISTLDAWLRACELNHPDCKPKDGQVPERFVSVGSSEGHPPRLMKFNHLNSPVQRYATLSYCWGGNKFRTTKETEESYSNELPWEQIPSTYRDAIGITRALGIKYLWIDALCILQDDPAEWQREASKMAGIYLGSSLTIAATDAADTSEGCFFDKHSILQRESNESTEVMADSLGCTFLSIRNSESGRTTLVRMQSGEMRDATRDAVLNTRGWVLQELILSPRTVHCMREGLYWHCNTTFKSETGVELDAMSLRKSPIPVHHQSASALNELWWKWMESYSKRSFTKPEDRLPAMAGLVRHYQSITGDVPILGLWERSFHQDLLWVRVEHQVNNFTIKNYQPDIPSWSWLSCLSVIRFDVWKSTEEVERDTTVCDHVTLIKWDLNWTSEELVSSIGSARMVINGPVQELFLSVASEGMAFNPPSLNVENEDGNFADKSIPCRCLGQFDFESRMAPEKYSCVLLRSRIAKNRRDRIGETFLILEPVLEHPNKYRRIGIGCISGLDRTFDLSLRRNVNLV